MCRRAFGSAYTRRASGAMSVRIVERAVATPTASMACLAAASGPAAIAIAADEHIDLVLLDLALPEMDGLAVCRALKGMPTEHRPVVAIHTALETPRDRANAEAAGDRK